MNAYDVAGWSDFATATASAAAALTGLLFVAVSINLRVVVAEAGVTDRAGASLLLLVTPVFLSLSLLVPGQGTVALAIELIVVGVGVGLMIGWLTRPRTQATEQPLISWIAVGVLPTLVLLVCPVLAAIGVLTHSLGGLYWVPVAVAVALVSGLVDAWVLLVEILR